jgi:Molybdopterin biosynthesis enzymes
MEKEISLHNMGEKKRLKVHILTVSSSRTLENDESGKLIENFMSLEHETSRSLCPDEQIKILRETLCNIEKDVIIITGGTGPSIRDVTISAVSKIAEKEIKGFGELFRQSSNEEIAYFSNASLFLIGRTQIYCLPGSPGAVKKGVEIIKKFIYHIYHELHKE